MSTSVRGARGAALSADCRGQLIEDLAQGLHRRRLGIPAIALLEAHKPLSFVASQILLAFSPLLSMLVGHTRLEEYAALLEDAGGVDCVITRLEELEELGHGFERAGPGRS